MRTTLATRLSYGALVALVGVAAGCGRTDGNALLACDPGKPTELIADTKIDNQVSGALAVLPGHDGAVYIAGYRTDPSNGKNRLYTERSVDYGQSWSAVDDYQFAAGQDTAPLSNLEARFLQLPDRRIFLTVNAIDGSGTKRGLLRWTSDGQSWSTTPSTGYLHPSATTGTTFTGLQYDSSSGILYVGGSFVAGSGVSMYAAKSTDSGATFTSLYTFQYSGGPNTTAKDLLLDSGHRLYLGGIGQGSGGGTDKHWILHRSTDGGATWAVADDFQLQAGRTSELHRLAQGPNGGIWALGKGNDGHDHWIVRYSSSGDPGTFTTVRNYQLASGSDASAEAIAFDRAGDVLVMGNASDGTALHMITQLSADGGATWTNIDDYSTPTVGTLATGLAVDELGDLFMTGLGNSAAFLDFTWVARRRPCR